MIKRTYTVVTKKRLTHSMMTRKHTKDAAVAGHVFNLWHAHLQEVSACVTGRKVLSIGETQFEKHPAHTADAVDYVLATEVVYRGWRK